MSAGTSAMEWLKLLGVGCSLAVLCALCALVFWPDGARDGLAQNEAGPAAIALAVLGDSNSHSYQDQITFPRGNSQRGGALRPQTLQWTEVLARLRPGEIDLGPWVRWGYPGVVAWGRELLGMHGGRSPVKEDYLYNFANSGESCKHIMGEHLGQRYRQAPRLVALMDKHPKRWERGVVVISIGANDWNPLLDLQARDPQAPELIRAIEYCRSQIQAAISLIHAHHPRTWVLVVGVGNEADDPANFDHFRSAAATANLRRAQDVANARLQALAEADPQRVVFMDYMPWFRQHWGERGPDGEPDYKTVSLGRLQIRNSAGDTADHALLADSHAGTAFNALWAQALVQRLREAFAMPLTPISEEEIVRLLGS